MNKEKVLVVIPTTASRLQLLKEVLDSVYSNEDKFDITTVIVKNGTFPNEDYYDFDELVHHESIMHLTDGVEEFPFASGLIKWKDANLDEFYFALYCQLADLPQGFIVDIFIE